MMSMASDEMQYRKGGDQTMSPDDATTAAAVAAALSAASAAAAAAVGLPAIKDDADDDLAIHQPQQQAHLLHLPQQNDLLAHLLQLQQSQLSQLQTHHQHNHLALLAQQQQHLGQHQHQPPPQHALGLAQLLSHSDLLLQHHLGHLPQLQQLQQQQQHQHQQPHFVASPQTQQQQFPQHHFGHLLQPQQQQQQLLHHLEMLAQANEDDLLDAAGRKVAPRSLDLFRVGPGFSETRHHQDIYCKKNDMDVNPILEARIDRGFETGENGTWIGYKRNYFTLVALFLLENFDFNRFIQNRFYTYEKALSKDGELMEKKVEILYFAIRLVAKCLDDEVAISLVQHTAKRDKGPQFPPPIYPAVPGDMPDHETVRALCNKRNGSKIESMNKVFYFDRAEYYHNANLDTLKDDLVLKNYPSDSIARVARFERIQFTLSIRLKSTLVNTRYFTLHVELLGIIEDEDAQIQPILLLLIETPPLIIRGRSPSNYHKDRTSGYRPNLHHH